MCHKVVPRSMGVHYTVLVFSIKVDNFPLLYDHSVQYHTFALLLCELLNFPADNFYFS